MKKLLLPLFAVLTMAACEANVKTDDGDADDTVENSLQNAGNNMMEGAGEAVDSAGVKLDRAGDRIEAGAERTGDRIDNATDNDRDTANH